MALLPLKLYKISRFFFFAIAFTQGFLLSHYMVEHEDERGFYGLAAMFIVVSLFVWFTVLCCKDLFLKYNLSVVWFSYSVALVIMIGVIFGRALIEDNKLREEEIVSCLYNATIDGTSHQSASFFDSKFLKITLCLTPGQMLLLLTSVTDKTEILTQLYFTTVMDLFDGVEMIEVLHEDVCDKIPMGWEIAVLVASCLFFLLSALEVHQVKFDENDQSKVRKKTVVVNTAFQIVLNIAFLVIRLVLWLKYDFDSAIFLAKNIISLIIALVGILESCNIITTMPDSDEESTPRSAQSEIGTRNYFYA